jgi:hypothetical protein
LRFLAPREGFESFFAHHFCSAAVVQMRLVGHPRTLSRFNGRPQPKIIELQLIGFLANRSRFSGSLTSLHAIFATAVRMAFF